MQAHYLSTDARIPVKTLARDMLADERSLARALYSERMVEAFESVVTVRRPVTLPATKLGDSGYKGAE